MEKDILIKYVQDEIMKGTVRGDIIEAVRVERNCSYDAARKWIKKIENDLNAANAAVAASTNASAAATANATVSAPAPASPNPANIPYNVLQPGAVVPVSQQLNANGLQIYDDIVACMNGKDVNPIDIMKAHHLNPAEWEVVSLKSNLWNAQQNDGKNTVKIPMYQSKLSVRPRNGGTLKLEDIEAWFENLRKSGFNIPNMPVPAIVPAGYADGVILEIPVADIHIGLLAWRAETGKDFDMKIVTDLFKNANMDLFNQVKANNIKVKKVIIPTLGDVLHVDNDQQTTTKGTFQQVDGRLPKIFDCAIDLMSWCIALWEQVAPVEYIYIRGNHDQVLGYAVAKALSLAFANHTNVTCDIEPNPHKYRKLVWNANKKSKKDAEKSVMLVFSHGDMNKANLEALPYTLAHHDMNGVSKRYIHVGHLHNQNSYHTRDGGTEVVHIDSFCYGSYWEHQQGYGETDSLFLNCYMWRRGISRPNVLTGDSSVAYK